MITTLRKGIHSKWFKVFLMIILGIFLFGSLGLSEFVRRYILSSSWVLKVNGTKILQDTFNDQVLEEQAKIYQLQQMFGAQIKDFGFNLDPKQLATQELIKKELIGRYADKLAIEIDPQLVQNEILRMLPAGKTIDQVCAEQGMSVEVLEQKIEQKLRLDTVLDIVNGAVYISKEDVMQRYNARYAQRIYSIATFPFAYYRTQAQKEKIEDAEIAAYFEKNNAASKRYWIPEQRSGVQWSFEPATFGVKVSQANIEGYYKKHQRDEFMSEPAKVKVERLLFAFPEDADEQATQDVEKKAREAHDAILKDPTQFAQQADRKTLDYFVRGTHDKNLETAAFALEKNGDISDVVRTKEGFVIVQRLDKKQAVFKPLEEVTHDITQKLTIQRFADSFMAQAQALLRSDEGKEAREEAIKKFVTEHKGVQEEVKEIALDKATTNAQKKLFDLKQSKFGIARDQNKKAYIVRLDTIIPAHFPKLDEVKSQVVEDIQADKARVLRDKALSHAYAQATQKSLEVVAKENNGTYTKTPLLNELSTKEVDALKEKQLPVADILAMTIVGGSIQNVNSKNDDAYIIRLDEQAPFNEADFETYQKGLRDTLYRERKQSIEEGFVASLHRNAIIEKNGNKEQDS